MNTQDVNQSMYLGGWNFQLKEEKKKWGTMPYKEICGVCRGNGYLTIPVDGKDEIKQCWVCESEGEKEYTQAEVDKFIYETYYKK